MKTKEEKSILIEDLGKKIAENPNFYLTDISTLNAEDTYKLRKACFSNNIRLEVVKNALLQKALEKSDRDFSQLLGIIKGSTSIMFCENSNAPAKLIKEFRKDKAKPAIKAAYVEECFYIGDDQLDALVNLKSKKQLIGEIIGLLQSPPQRVISALLSGKNILGGVVKTLQDKQQ